MPDDEVKRILVRQWIDKAEQDMEAAEAPLSEDRPILYPSCFHSQQVAEKYIKAFLTWHQIEFPKTHVFGGLLDLIGNVNTNLATKLADAASLNPMA